MKYCCHVWDAAPKSTSDRVLRRDNCLVSESAITDKLDSLAHRRNIVDLFYKSNHDHCSKKVSEVMPNCEKLIRHTRDGNIA